MADVRPCEPNRLFCCGIIVLLGALAPPVGAGEQAAPGPIALIAAIDGPAHVMLPRATRATALRLFDRLPVDATITTGSQATVLVVFRTGARARITPDSLVKVADRSLETLAGRIERLADVPPLPVFDPPAADVPRGRVAAVRIRGEEFDDLYPRGEARSLADATELAFVPKHAYGAYDVEIFDQGGRVVFMTRATEPRVVVPANVLDPGRSYVWRVSARTPSGAVIHGQARFATLTAEQRDWRRAARRAVQPQAVDALWLAEIDLALGLLREARGVFHAAGVRRANDVISARIAAIDRVLQASPTQESR